MSPSCEVRAAAVHSATSDLFLMVFAPSIYIESVKFQSLLVPLLPSKRLCHSPFLLWSDLNLLCLARTDATKIFVNNNRTLKYVLEALNDLATISLPNTMARMLSRLANSYL
ncbi:hypothetical protein Plhal304r1_c048g0130101 [Plasmopara halstedii]